MEVHQVVCLVLTHLVFARHAVSQVRGHTQRVQIPLGARLSAPCQSQRVSQPGSVGTKQSPGLLKLSQKLDFHIMEVVKGESGCRSPSGAPRGESQPNRKT